MKILFVTPYLPSPPRFGAQRRLDGLMRGLSTRHEVSLLSFAADDEHLSNSLRETSSYCHKVTTVPASIVGLDVGAKRVMQTRSLFSPRSFEYRLCYSEEFQKRIHQVLADTDFDVVQVEFCHLGIFDYTSKRERQPLLIVDEHNIEFEIIQRTAASEGSFARRFYSAVNWRKLRREEMGTWRKFDGVVLTSNRDEDVLRGLMPDVRTTVVPNAVDLDYFKTSSVPREPATLIFFGAMNYHPNIQGVSYFVSDVLPRIAKEVPAVRLLVVGQNPPESIRALAGPNVEVVGFVDDPRELLDRASAMVVPLLIGGGTRFKIVEGMAMSTPIVSTYLGAEGLDVEHGKHLLLAGNSEELARETIRLLKNPELGRRLGREARLLAEERYGWPHAVRQLESFYSKCRSD
jgi:glycosyltransferase involved in cell wall biosynthesis